MKNDYPCSNTQDSAGDHSLASTPSATFSPKHTKIWIYRMSPSERLEVIKQFILRVENMNRKELDIIKGQVEGLSKTVVAHQAALEQILHALESISQKLENLEDTDSCIIHDIKLLRGDYEDDNEGEASPCLESSSPASLGHPLSPEPSIRKQIIINLMSAE